MANGGANVIRELQRFEERFLRGLPPILQASEARVHEAIAAGTPVRTGHMRDNLRKASEFVPVETEYSVFWRSEDFPPGFYPAEVVLGGPEQAADDMMTPALQGEGPQLVQALTQHGQQAARGG